MDKHRHTSSSTGKHFRDKHSSTPKDLTTNFTILKKCNSKFDFLIYEMFFLLTNWDQVSTYNEIQFVRTFLNSFPFILFLYALIVFNTPFFYIFMLLHLSLHFFVLLYNKYLWEFLSSLCLIMTVERSKRRFLIPIVFITKCFKNTSTFKSIN